MFLSIVLAFNKVKNMFGFIIFCIHKTQFLYRIFTSYVIFTKEKTKNQ
jgi:hypothetical protein